MKPPKLSSRVRCGYWRRYGSGRPPEALLGAVIHDMRREMQDIESLVAFILNDAEAAATPIEHLSRKMAVQEVCELILRRKDTMNDILNMVSHYVC